MSVEPQVLGVAGAAGGGGAAASTLVNTGNPVLVGILTALAMVVILGIITRRLARQG